MELPRHLIGQSTPPGMARRRTGFRRAVALQTALLVVAVLPPLWAIPSPDVVIGLFASAAQVLGLLGALLGGAFVATRGRRRPGGARGPACVRSGRAMKWSLGIVGTLLLLSIGANVLQYARRADEQNRRLRANLFRSSKENGARVGDTSLKTLSLSGQLEHPRGVSTEELARLLAADQRAREAQEGCGTLNFVDVREPEEVEVGRIRGSWQIRYPDLRLRRELLVKPGKKTVLFCYSGNRSSELCDEFDAAGIPCFFVAGGYEKWVAEGRPVERPSGTPDDELRGLPGYPNKERLLDTPEVERLVRERGAVFVDVRYEKEFEAFHLPDAVNVPIRKLPTQEMDAQLRALPRKPIIAACYDKRSSFYGQILGLRLHRMGYEYLGRYTVPHEYFVAGAERPYIAGWKAARDHGPLALLTRPLAALIEWLDLRLGHLALAIAAAVALLRLALLPLTVKSERDQAILRTLGPELARLREVTRGDDRRHARAVRGLYRKHRLTPGRNLVASLLQILVFIAFFAAVSRAARETGDGFLWIESLGAPDALAVFPVLLGVLAFAHLELGAGRKGWGRRVLNAAGAVLLGAITVPLSAALGLYLSLNVLWMFVQGRVVSWALRRREGGREEAPRELVSVAEVIPLERAHAVAGCGNKAQRLARMRAAGLPVPAGFVLPAAFLKSRDAEGGRLRHVDRQRIDALWRRLGLDAVAVRSSGLNEDGASQSYAGVFESVLNVRRDGFERALEEVRASLSSRRAQAYSMNGVEEGAILVQQMVPAEYAGVLFTEHPTETGSMLVELVDGLGDRLVSGTATPKSFRLGRWSGRLLDEDSSPIDLAPLVALARRVEALFGGPQDIEWAFHRGRFMLLQARDITTSISRSKAGGGKVAFEGERKRLLEIAAETGDGTLDPDEPLFVQNELSELLPRPTPLSLSFMESLWELGGSTDLACRALGIPYEVEEDAPAFVESVFGAVYINRREESRRMRRGPGMLASFRLARNAESMERRFRDEFLPGFVREVRWRESIDLKRLASADLFALLEDWLERFRTETYVEAEMVNIAASVYVKAAERELTRRGLPVAEHVGHVPETVVHKAMSLLPDIHRGVRPASDFLDLFGHRAPLDWELASPRYVEDPWLVGALAARAAPAQRGPVDARPAPHPLPEGRLLGLTIERARRFQALKEEAKHHALRELALLRRVFLEVGRRVHLDEDIFYLELDEVRRLRVQPASFADLSRRVAERKFEAACFAGVRLPTKLSLLDLESASEDGAPRRASPICNGELRGLVVAGDAEALGPARVISRPDEVDLFQEGEILVARYSDPSWTPLFPRAAGVVTEVGGQLSHAAIVAREFNTTAIVGVDGALQKIRTGEVLRLLLDGRVLRVEERRRAPRHQVSLQAFLRKQNDLLEAIIENVSSTGALVSAGPDLELGEGVTLRLEDVREEFEACVVRDEGTGRYGLRFTSTIALGGVVGPMGN